MGNGAATQTGGAGSDDADARRLKAIFFLHKKTESVAMGAFDIVDKDDSGGIELEEFILAAKAVGMDVPPEEVKAVFELYDKDGSGSIDKKEFLKFIEEKQATFFDEDSVAVDQMSPEALKYLIPYLGPAEASRGFKKALLILKKNPTSAATPLSKDNPMLPIHVMLLADAPVPPSNGKEDKGKAAKAKAAAKEAATQAAGPLLSALCAAHPAGAQVRIKASETRPDGVLPLHMAIEQKWPLEVVKTVLDAWPEAATTLDASKSKKGVRVAPTLKAGRWARKLAEDSGCDPEVVRLFPMPKKKGADVEWLTQEQLDAAPEKKGKKDK